MSVVVKMGVLRHKGFFGHYAWKCLAMPGKGAAMPGNVRPCLEKVQSCLETFSDMPGKGSDMPGKGAAYRGSPTIAQDWDQMELGSLRQGCCTRHCECENRDITPGSQCGCKVRPCL